MHAHGVNPWGGLAQCGRLFAYSLVAHCSLLSAHCSVLVAHCRSLRSSSILLSVCAASSPSPSTWSEQTQIELQLGRRKGSAAQRRVSRIAVSAIATAPAAAAPAAAAAPNQRYTTANNNNKLQLGTVTIIIVYLTVVRCVYNSYSISVSKTICDLILFGNFKTKTNQPICVYSYLFIVFSCSNIVYVCACAVQCVKIENQQKASIIQY